uniref:RNase H type-1 domain-containing protein n=1 Tax=Fagus sylvatica TaxID=28930 RepID=A0A2N9G8A8_FAGSY
MTTRLVFTISPQINIMVPENMVYGSPENMKKAGHPHYPVVHGGLPSGPRQTNQRFTTKLSHKGNLRRQPAVIGDEADDEEDDARAEKTKKSPMAAQDQSLPWPPPLESSDHHSPALRWSLLLHITELRKHGLELIHGIWGLQPCHLKRSTRQNSVANSHAEVESQGHSHAMGETHAQGGGQTLGEENPLGGGQAHGGGQVLGGGEIPVGGPQQMALMFEMIKGMQQNQIELAESLRQLREANGNKEDHQNKNDNRNHEERESHNKNDTPFVTMSDVADLLKQERERPPKEPRHFVRRPPYPIELLKEPYPEKYDTPVFALFDGRKGSAMEHISKFLDSMGPFAAHGDLCLREFSKSLVDRAYTWYTVLPAGSIRTWEDMVESFCSKYFHVEEKITLVNLHSTKQQIGEDLVKYIHRFRDVSLDCHVKYQEGELVEKDCHFSQAFKLKRAGTRRVYLQTLTVSTATAPSDGRSTVKSKMVPYNSQKHKQKVHQIPFPNYNKDKGKAVVSVVIHGNVSDMEAEESAAASSSLKLMLAVPFLETTNAITFTDEDMEVQYPDHRRPLYLSAVVKDVQVRRALVDTGSCLNLIPLSTLQAVNVPQQKIQGSPMEVTGFGGMTEHTMGHVQLVLKVGPIVALTRFHVVNAETPYHVLLGRPWLHKHKLVSSTYHQCVKGRLNGKPIRIAANSCPFDQTEAHFVEAALYDDLASTGEPSIVRPCGTPLPAWEDIKDDPEIDLRELLERKKKRKEREVEHGSPPQCVRVQAPRWTHRLSLMKTENSGKVVVDQPQSTTMSKEKSTTAEPNITSKEELEVINLSNDPDITKPISISKSLSAKERKCLIDLLHEYKDVFAWDYHEMPGIDPGLVAHSLNVEPGTRPVVQPMRTFHTEVEAQITQEVKKLLAAGFIKPIQHPRWLSNIVPIQPPVIAMFSFMDGFSGYNQIRMSTRDAEKTAFCTPISNFYYTVMPFGLKNAGATYQRTMTAMFHDMMHKEIEDYVDDIVVKSKKREDHLRILRKVFDRCRLYKLKMNPLKCAFGVSAGKFLGFLVHNRGIDVDPAKASAIATMKAPTSHKELKSFLGRLSYIRRFIPGLAAVTATFMPLMKKGVPFVWSTACQQAFEKIQLIMTKLPTVCAPVPGRPLRLYLASNNEAIGGLVAQEDEDGTEKPIYYVSRALRDAETRYSGAERASIKSQAIADLLAQFPGEDSSSISHEVPGEIGEALLADLADSTWTLKFDGSSTSNSSGAGIVLTREDGETIAKSFKLDFSCSNNASEYEAYITGLVIAHEMGIKHLRVIGDSNLIICQTKGEFSLKEPSLALYRALAQKLEEKFDTFEISHAMRCENRYADALATLGSQTAWRSLSKMCEASKKQQRKLTEVHEMCCELRDGVSLYRRLQRLGYFWPSMSKEAAKSAGTVLILSTPAMNPIKFMQHSFRVIGAPLFLEYFIENVLPQTSQAATRLKKLATRYFVEGGILFRKGFHGDPLRCLSLAESQTVMKEAHSGECGEHQGKKRLYQLLLTLGYYWPTMKKDTADFVKSCHTCQLQANLIHTHPTSLQNMATPWPFHTWGLDLIGPINPSSGGYIWILVATEYFSKWVEGHSPSQGNWCSRG